MPINNKLGYVQQAKEITDKRDEIIALVKKLEFNIAQKSKAIEQIFDEIYQLGGKDTQEIIVALCQNLTTIKQDKITNTYDISTLLKKENPELENIVNNSLEKLAAIDQSTQISTLIKMVTQYKVGLLEVTNKYSPAHEVFDTCFTYSLIQDIANMYLGRYDLAARQLEKDAMAYDLFTPEVISVYIGNPRHDPNAMKNPSKMQMRNEVFIYYTLAAICYENIHEYEKAASCYSKAQHECRGYDDFYTTLTIAVMSAKQQALFPIPSETEFSFIRNNNS